MPCGPCGHGNIGLPIVRSTRPSATACITSPPSSGPMEVGGRCGSATRISPARRTRFTAPPRCSWPIAISIKSKAPRPSAAWSGCRPPWIPAGAGAAAGQGESRGPSSVEETALAVEALLAAPSDPRRQAGAGSRAAMARPGGRGVASSPGRRHRPAPGPTVVLRKGLSAGLHRFGVGAGREAAFAAGVMYNIMGRRIEPAPHS